MRFGLEVVFRLVPLSPSESLARDHPMTPYCAMDGRWSGSTFVSFCPFTVPSRGAPEQERWKFCIRMVRGLDVHKDSVVACVRRRAGGEAKTAVKTFRSVTVDLVALSDWLEAEGVTHIAMAATGVYWRPVWHVLSDGAFTLVLANAAHVKNVPGRKTDVKDAVWLADLMAHGLIRASFVPDQPTQQMRNLLRTRKQFVRERTSHIQRLQKTLEDANVKKSELAFRTRRS